MNEQEQMIQQLQLLVSAAMLGDQLALLLIQLISQAAQLGDQQAALIMLVIQEMIKQMLGALPAPQLIPASRNGSKLEYIKSLKGQCPEGYEMKYMKAGGSVCPVCLKKKAKKAEEGTKVQTVNKSGAVSKAMEGIKAELAKCGSKMVHKKQDGGKESFFDKVKKTATSIKKPVNDIQKKVNNKKQDAYEKAVMDKNRSKHTFDGPMASEG